MRRFVAFGVVVSLAVACVDLFHATDFQTLCDRDPGNAACVGDANADANKPLLDFCQWNTAVARENAIRTCAWLGACEGPLGETAFGRCVIRAFSAYDCNFNPGLRPTGRTHAAWSCLAQVRSCAEVDACLFADKPAECAPVPTGSFTACAASARVECAKPDGGRAAGVEPCALEGRTCGRIDDSRSSCAGTAGVGCEAGASCNGTSAVDCAPSGGTTIDRGRDCAELGAGRCLSSDAGAACEPVGSSLDCTEGLAVACEGSNATSCVARKKILFDCARLGTKCDTTVPLSTTDPVAACADRTSATRCTGPDRCEGTKLESCANGLKFEVSCDEVGLGPCVKGVNDLAACSPP